MTAEARCRRSPEPHFLTGAVLVLRADTDDDDEARLKADAAGFWPVAATSFGVIALAITGGRGLLRILPMRWISRLAALVMVVMAAVTLAEANPVTTVELHRKRQRIPGVNSAAAVSTPMESARTLPGAARTLQVTPGDLWIACAQGGGKPRSYADNKPQSVDQDVDRENAGKNRGTGLARHRMAQ